MRDQRREIERHVDAGVGAAEKRVVEMRGERPVHLAVRAMRRPARPASRRPARKPTAGFDCRKPKPFASSAGIRLRKLTSLTSITSRTCAQCIAGRASHRHVAGDDGDLGFEVDAVGLVAMHDVGSRAQHAVGGALVHQRIGPELRRHHRAARAAHELDVIDVRRAVDPLVRARQRRHRIARVERPRIGNASRAESHRRSRRATAHSASSRRAPPAACARSAARRRSARGRATRRRARRRACRRRASRASSRRAAGRQRRFSA